MRWVWVLVAVALAVGIVWFVRDRKRARSAGPPDDPPAQQS
jgi:hypothetical protein